MIVQKDWELHIDDFKEVTFEDVLNMIEYKTSNLPIDQYMFIPKETKFRWISRCNKNHSKVIYALTTQFQCVKLY